MVSSDHVNLFLVQTRALSGDSRLEMVEVEVDNWLTGPKNEWISVWLAGVGKSVMDGST